MTFRESLRKRLLARRVITPHGCWEFAGAKAGKGYGYLSVTLPSRRKRLEYAHRVAAFAWKGFNLDSPLHILHSCDNPPCFRPAHLFEGTKKDNAQDAIRKGKWRQPQRDHHGEKNPAAKLTKGKVQEIHALLKRGIFQKNIAERFEISQTQVSHIAKGKAWGSEVPHRRQRHSVEVR